MYQNIKQNIRNRLILWTTILTILGLLCLVYSILRIKLFPHLFAFSSILLGPEPCTNTAAGTGPVIPSGKVRRPLSG